MFWIRCFGLDVPSEKATERIHKFVHNLCQRTSEEHAPTLPFETFGESAFNGWSKNIFLKRQITFLVRLTWKILRARARPSRQRRSYRLAPISIWKKYFPVSKLKKTVTILFTLKGLGDQMDWPMVDKYGYLGLGLNKRRGWFLNF
jgi:hypothetical protein